MLAIPLLAFKVVFSTFLFSLYVYLFIVSVRSFVSICHFLCFLYLVFSKNVGIYVLIFKL